ncbi:hypothetical protein MPH_09949, partial [Macrophomina phaseolina MS6]
ILLAYLYLKLVLLVFRNPRKYIKETYRLAILYLILLNKVKRVRTL